jgi:nucleoside 2-deoxyribosyltransferase
MKPHTPTVKEIEDMFRTTPTGFMPLINPVATIYTAGGGGLGVEYAHAWRNEAAALLPEFQMVSPFRGGKIERAYKGGHYSGAAVFTPNEIVVRDLQDIKNADMVLAEMRDEQYNYIGTNQEIFYAASLGLPVVLWTTDKYALHPWLVRHCVRIFTGELDEVCEYVRGYWKGGIA